MAMVRALYESPAMDGQEPPEGMVPPAPSASAYAARHQREVERVQKIRDDWQREREIQLQAAELQIRAAEAAKPPTQIYNVQIDTHIQGGGAVSY